MKTLICNAGSSTLKFSLFEADGERLVASGGIDWSASPARLSVKSEGRPDVREEIDARRQDDAIARILDVLGTGREGISAVGHRVVHGGERYTAAVRITPEVKRAIADLADLAPLHNPPSLEAIEAAERLLPGVPQVAAFDTAFHATLSEAARTYPLPQAWTREWGLRRYGFHGLSHAYCASRAAEILGPDLRLVIAHLGNGASVSAVRGGRCVDTSMGFTPLEGLMMGTRSGSVDPGLLLYLLREKGVGVERLDRALNHESGLLGISGASSDMREVLSAEASSPAARLAVEVYVHRIRQTVGAMAATLGGVDALVFTAGVGENSAAIRERVCETLSHLGLGLDRARNEACRPDADVATPASPGRILVLATREDVTIVREIRRLIGPTARRESEKESPT